MNIESIENPIDPYITKDDLKKEGEYSEGVQEEKI